MIDIPEDVFRYLSVKAAAKGINLKQYIENLLAKDVEDIDDSETYRKLLQSESDGTFPASEEEQKEFRKWLIPRGEAYAQKGGEELAGKR